MDALERRVAGGEWTSGRGPAAVTTLSALAARIGYPVEALVRGGPRRLIIVQRGQEAVHARLTALARRDVAVLYERKKDKDAEAFLTGKDGPRAGRQAAGTTGSGGRLGRQLLAPPGECTASLFRAPSLERAQIVLEGMAGLNGFAWPNEPYSIGGNRLKWLLPALAIALWGHNRQTIMTWRVNRDYAYAIAFALLSGISILRLGEPSPFPYFLF